MKPSMHRRAFLRAVGAGLATLPFVRVVENAYAQSMGEALPQRFIGAYHPHGIAAELFTMRDGETPTKFELAYPDSPLQRCRSASAATRYRRSSIQRWRSTTSSRTPSSGRTLRRTPRPTAGGDSGRASSTS